MTRRLCYDVSFHDSAATGAQIVLRLALARISPHLRADHARAMAATIPFNTIKPALAWFQAMAGNGETVIPFVKGDDIVITLPACVTAQWQIAVLLNMIDFALAEDEEPLKLITKVRVLVRDGDQWGFPDVLEDLQNRIEISRQNLTNRLPETTFIDEFTLGEWPQDAEYYTFQISWIFDAPLSALQTQALGELLEGLELVVAWMGFALEGTAEEWQAAGKMIFPGQTTAMPQKAIWHAERPYSDISFACFWIERLIVKAYRREVTIWRSEIQPLEG